jgi:putative hemolysin
MTPRPEIVHVDLRDALAVNLHRMAESGHSRFPVSSGDLDHVVGIVQAKALLEDRAAGRAVELAACVSKPLFVPGPLTVMELVESFKKHRQTLAPVTNEYGAPQGLVTLTDVMQALVGDSATMDEPSADLDVVQREDGSWLIDGSVTIERSKDVLDVPDELPGEESGVFQTLGGFVMTELGRVPQVGDKLQSGGVEYEVVDMDGRRVDKLLVKTVPPLEDGAGEPVD